jgi:biopolymer transport protein TolQ
MDMLCWGLDTFNQIFSLPVVQSQVARVGWLGVDLFDAIRQSDIVGKACLIVTALFSVVSWGVIGYKFIHIRQATSQTDDFIDGSMNRANTLDEAYKSTADYPDSPLAQVMRESYLELQIENWYQDYKNLSTDERLNVAKAGIERVQERTITQEMRHLDSYLIFLATTANVAPFIGLFGTVWGVLGCFQSLGTGTASIIALGPGISTALMTTVAGLVAAIPAAVTYNYLTNKVQILESRMDSFALELSNIIHKQLLRREMERHG